MKNFMLFFFLGWGVVSSGFMLAQIIGAAFSPVQWTISLTYNYFNEQWAELVMLSICFVGCIGTYIHFAKMLRK